MNFIDSNPQRWSKAQHYRCMKGFDIHMKRHILIILFIVLSVFVFTACGGGQPEVQLPVNTPPWESTDGDSDDDPAPVFPGNVDNPGAAAENNGNDDPLPQQVFSFKMGDVLIEMGQDINYVLDRAGEPTGVFEAPSCAFDGIDRIFAYPGIQIYTYPDGDNDFIHTIAFFDDSIRTTEGGIRLGSSLQAVFDVYGDEFEYDSSMYTFRRGLTKLEFLVEDDMVMGISYGLQLNF